MGYYTKHLPQPNTCLYLFQPPCWLAQGVPGLLPWNPPKKKTDSTNMCRELNLDTPDLLNMFQLPFISQPSRQRRPVFRSKSKNKTQQLVTNVEASLIPNFAVCVLPCLFVNRSILSQLFQGYFFILGGR